MPPLHHILKVLSFAALFLFFAGPLPSSAATTDELIAACDTQASDPQDPDAHAKPVKDDDIAFGAAIEACRAAVAAKPDFSRGWYELARAYHLARRNTDAFDAYTNAAVQKYGPALRAIGEAFATGKGLPPGHSQDPKIARDYFEKAIAAGDNFAQDSIDNMSSALASTTFDSSIFQNPQYMSDLYSGNAVPPGTPERAHFLAYMHGVADTLGGETVFFIDQSCQQFVAKFNLSSMEVELQTLINGSMVNSDGSLKNGLNINNDTINGIAYDQDNGKRDARTLMHTYSCKSAIISQITNTIKDASSAPVTADRIGKMFPGPMGEVVGIFLGGAPGLNSRTPAPTQTTTPVQPVTVAPPPVIPHTLADVFAIQKPSQHYAWEDVMKTREYIKTLPQDVQDKLFENLPDGKGWDVLVDRAHAYLIVSSIK